MHFEEVFSCETLLPEKVFVKLDQKFARMDMVSSLTAGDVPNLCRTCLGSDNLKPLLAVTFEGVPITEIFQKVTSIQVTENDEMPLNICTTCLLDLIRAYAFNEKCHQVNTLLQAARLNDKEPDDIQMGTDIKDEDIDVKEDILIVDPYPLAIAKEECLYECENCSQIFNTSNELRNHKDEYHPIKKVKQSCPICLKLISKIKLEWHMKSHTKEKSYECNMCLQKFSSTCNLKRHIMTHTGEKPHTCEICGRGFIQATAMQRHKMTHVESDATSDNSPPYICNECGRSFIRFTCYKAHLKRHDSQDTQEVEAEDVKTEDETKNYICDICSRAYKCEKFLKVHQLTHGKKDFLCSYCGKGFVTKGALQSHLTSHTGEKPYTCLKCGKCFAHISSLHMHGLTHTGQKPHSCTMCDKSFAQRSHLKYHMRIHNGERPYKCKYCDKAFTIKSNLTVHLRIHTGETPYLCSICNKGFHDSSSMKKHQKAHEQFSIELLNEN